METQDIPAGEDRTAAFCRRLAGKEELWQVPEVRAVPEECAEEDI